MSFSFTRARGMSVPAIPSFRTLISPATSPTRPTADSQPTSPSHLKWSSIDLTEEEDEDHDNDIYSRTSSFHTPTTSALSSPTTSPGSGLYKTLSPEVKNMSSTDSGLSSRRSHYDDAVDPTADLGGESHDLESDLPDVDALPQDVSRLQDIIRANRVALEKRNTALTAAQDRLEKLSRSHDDLLERSSQWKDELETLQANHATVQQQLSTSKADNEGLGEQIKDLRYRSEESRRAILRLQGERKTTGGGGGVAGDRRSVAAGSLAGWNPSLLQGDANASGSSSEDAAAAKSSKRSTILFGAPSAAAQRRHVRTGSSSNVVASPTPSEAGQETERTPQQVSANSLGGGLRGLRLGFDRRPSGEGDEKEGEGAAAAAASPTVPLTRRSLLLPPGGNSSSRPPSTQSVSPTPSASGSGLGSPLMGDGQFLPLPSSPALSASGDSDIPTARPTQTFATAGAGMSAMQIVRLKDDELAKMQGELKALRAKLDEAIEGRRASDACLKALKEFIGEGGPEGEEAARAALRGVKLPPLPTDDDEETIDAGPGARPNGAAADSWWTSVIRKASAAQPTATGAKRVGSSTTAPSTGGAPSEVLSTSPSNLSTTSGRQSAMDESSPHPSSSSFTSAAPTTGGGLASFGSFFARTASTSPQPPQPPSKSPEQQQQELGRSVSGGSGTSETSGGGAGVNASPRRPLNRLSTWFSKPTPATPGEPASSALPTVASPPFASLEESTLHRVDLSATPRKSSASALGGAGGGGSDIGSMNNGLGAGMGLGLTGAGAAVGVSRSDEAGPPAPPHKEVPLSARAAKADARVADVGEDGLDGGPLVAPTFD